MNTQKISYIIFKPIRVIYYLILNIFFRISYKLTLLKYRRIGRNKKEAETSKAKERRISENFFENYTNGIGLDIGYGGDPITPNVFVFDIEHGDATEIKKFKNKSFDFIYSSHLLEHLINPSIAIINWWERLNPNGYLIIYIPDRDLYEKKDSLPSLYNTDHKSFFTLKESTNNDTINILTLIKNTISDFEIIYAKICDLNYQSNGINHPSGEYSIEIIIKKIK